MDNLKNVMQLVDIIKHSYTSHEIDYLVCRLTGTIGNIRYIDFKAPEQRVLTVINKQLLSAMLHLIAYKHPDYKGYDWDKKVWHNTSWEFNTGYSIDNSQSEKYGVGTRIVVKENEISHVSYLTIDGKCELESGDEMEFIRIVNTYLK